MNVLSALILSAALLQPVAFRQTDIDNEQKVPLFILGESRSGKPADLFPPTTYTVAPPSAGMVDAQNWFVPADGFEGQATVTVESLNRKGDLVTGQIVFTVSNAPAIAITVTAGDPIDK